MYVIYMTGGYKYTNETMGMSMGNKGNKWEGRKWNTEGWEM